MARLDKCVHAPSPPPLPATTRTWWDRNWKWVAALAGVITVLVSVASVSLLQGVMKGSEPFQIALKRARQSPAVISALGTPLQEGWFVAGQVQLYGPVGDAALSGRLTGPQGEGALRVSGKRSSGAWHLQIVLEVDKTGERIDLSDPGMAPPTPPKSKG